MSEGSSNDRELLRRSHPTLGNDVSLIASEFLAGFQLVQRIDRPAVSIFGSARVAETTPTYEAARTTARLFAEAGLAVTPIGEYTHAPEILGGRVKTLHPRIHGGILYRRGLPEDEADVQARDAVATLILTREDELLSLLVQVARRVVPPDDAPVCTLVAWTAYARGEGALANVALDRALAATAEAVRC